jgi:hypothetical protein
MMIDNLDNLNEAQAERHGSYHAGRAECLPKDILNLARQGKSETTETKPTRRPEHRRYFEALAWFDSPEDATEAKAALAAAGYTFEQTPYVFDVHEGFLIAPTVYGVITGYAGIDDMTLVHQLLEIIRPFGECDDCGFLDMPTSQAERYRRWTGGNLADVQRAIEGKTSP